LEKQLTEWAGSDDDDTAQKILAGIAPFKKALDVVRPLWRVATEIVRPAEEVKVFHQLIKLLVELDEKGLVRKMSGRRNYPSNAIVIGMGHNSTAYIPAMAIPMAAAGWPWLKKAEERSKLAANERIQKLLKMEEQVTDLTPAEAAIGKEGHILLRTGPTNGALLRIKDRQFFIAESVGILIKTHGWKNMTTGEQNWPDSGLYHAFRAWEKQGAPAPATTAPAK